MPHLQPDPPNIAAYFWRLGIDASEPITLRLIRGPRLVFALAAYRRIGDTGRAGETIISFSYDEHQAQGLA